MNVWTQLLLQSQNEKRKRNFFPYTQKFPIPQSSFCELFKVNCYRYTIGQAHFQFLVVLSILHISAN